MNNESNWIIVAENKQSGQFVVGYADTLKTAELAMESMLRNNSYPSKYGRPEKFAVYPKSKLKKVLILD